MSADTGTPSDADRVTEEPERRPEPRTGPIGRAVEATGNRIVTIILLVMAVFWMIPTFGLLIASLRPPDAHAESGWWNVFTRPAELTIENYRGLVEDPDMMGALLNTVLITVPATLIVVLVAATAAYAFAFLQFPGRDVLFLIVVGLLVVPLQLGLIPIAQLYSNIGLFGTIPGVVLFHVGYGLPFAVFLLRNFFIGIPTELLEAARVNGAREPKVFRKVVLPLGLPALAALTIFQFLWVWNDLLIALVFAGPGAAPLTVAIQENLRQFGANIDIIAPAAFLSMAVPLAIFLAFQRYFVQGMLAGSAK
jgi:alpha-glucoside transport system permease protein